MNFENIIVIVVCFVAIAVVAYCFYSKYSSQQKDMNALSKRFETIEMMFATPPPQKELSDVYNRKHDPQHEPRDSDPQRINDQTSPDPIKSWENTTNPILNWRAPEESSSQEHHGSEPLERDAWNEKRTIRTGPSFAVIGPFGRAYPLADAQQRLLEPLVPSKACEGLCDLQPLQLETNEAEIDEIDAEIDAVEDEINNIGKYQNVTEKI